MNSIAPNRQNARRKNSNAKLDDAYLNDGNAIMMTIAGMVRMRRIVVRVFYIEKKVWHMMVFFFRIHM
jgi:hypothetical protein